MNIHVANNFLISSPLEQFNVKSIIPLYFGNFDISFTNSSLYFLFCTGIILILFQAVTLNGGFLVPTRWQSIVEIIYDFVVSLVGEQIGEKGKPYFTWIFTTFILILACNLVGMIPYSFTTTSHVAVTFGLALSLFVGITIIGFQNHGLHFFSFFLPKGTPLALVPLLVLIEVMSYCTRPISLGVRLFVNLISGHALLKILSGFAWTMLCSGGFLAVGSLIPFVVIVAITGLELAVSSLQAYVFCILTCIYLKDAIDLH
jgi:ATP synthase subunit 6